MAPTSGVKAPNLLVPVRCDDGTDRFAIHLSKAVFNCRVCAGRGHGAIDLEMFLTGCTFAEAVAHLAGEDRPTPQFAAAPPQRQRAQIAAPRRRAAHLALRRVDLRHTGGGLFDQSARSRWTQHRPRANSRHRRCAALPRPLPDRRNSAVAVFDRADPRCADQRADRHHAHAAFRRWTQGAGAQHGRRADRPLGARRQGQRRNQTVAG